MNYSIPYGDLYNWSVTDPTSFWHGQAEAIHWQTPFHTVCDFTNPPFARWFVGGKTNLCYNAVDRHLETRANQPAIFFHSSESGTEQVITYRQLHREVTSFAAVLKKLGINKGDRVVIYLPMIPEAAYAMLACARIGAIHSVVFAGFAASSLANRIVDTQAKLVVTAVTGEDLPRGQKGVLACEIPLPPGCLSTIWQNDQLFAKHYFQQIPGRHLYSTFDYAEQDEDGYYYILGRTDDVINVAGHRIGTREIEETINSHTDIAESAAIGAYDEIKGQAIHCFAVVRQAAAKGEEQLKKEILQIILRNLGAIARPAAIHIVKGLPKTRSGKILRRAIQAVAEGKQNLGDLSTLEDYIALEGLRSVVADAKLRELRNLAFAIWMGRVQGGGSYFGHELSDWFTARNKLGIPLDVLL